MDYSIIGFPRIGIHRELKFATEAYFRSEIDADELKRVVSQQRMEQWTRQRDAGAGFIPSNDFSLYDGMLDTAYMLNAIPRRYADLRLSDIDTYFAMARGYQGAQGDVKAFTMKKWFNTNYHYMVPELDDDMELKLRSDAFLDGFHQARSLGIQTKPVVMRFRMMKLEDSRQKKASEPVQSAEVWCMKAKKISIVATTTAILHFGKKTDTCRAWKRNWIKIWRQNF